MSAAYCISWCKNMIFARVLLKPPIQSKFDVKRLVENNLLTPTGGFYSHKQAIDTSHYMTQDLNIHAPDIECMHEGSSAGTSVSWIGVASDFIPPTYIILAMILEIST